MSDRRIEVTFTPALADRLKEMAAALADDQQRRDAELRDRLDALDDAQTETALDTLLRNAPDLQRKALRELSLIDHDATVDALNETGA